MSAPPYYDTEHIEECVRWLSKLLGYTFQEKAAAVAALLPGPGEAMRYYSVRIALSTTSGAFYRRGQKQLAWVGDAVLYTLTTPLLLDEEDPTVERTKWVSNEALAIAAIRVGLHRRVLVCPSQVPSAIVKGQPGCRLLGTTVEAVLGAVFLDSGEDLLATKRAALALGILPTTQASLKQCGT